MSHQEEPELDRGQSRILSPQARPNIHEYAMGKYGTKNSPKNKTPPAKGQDVTDNVQSKPLKRQVEKEPLPFKNIVINPESNTLDSSVSENSQSDQLPSRRNSNDTSNESRNYTHNSANNSSFNWQDSISYVETPDEQGENKKLPYMWLAILVAICAVTYYYTNILSNIPQEQNSYQLSSEALPKQDLFSKEIRSIAKEYKIDKDSVLKITTGISTIFKKQDTGSFLFVYRSTNTGEQGKVDEFINEVADVTSKYLRDGTAKHLVLEGSKMEMQSHSELIRKYKENITKNGVMVVKDIDEVPSKLAMAFHYYCDDQNPVAKRSAVLFTLDVRKCSYTDEEVTNSYIEKCLKKKWSGVPEDNILPLLNRVMSYIVDITAKHL